MKKVRYFMCPYISLKDGCKYGRALVSVKIV